MTQAPTMPASGSIQSQPKARASNRPTMTSTDTAASAMTWMMAARMLLSRAAAPCACSCSSKATGWLSPAELDMRGEGVRLRNFVDGLQIAAPVDRR